MRAVDVILREQEIRIVNKVISTSNLDNDAVSISWDTSATAVPRSDVLTGIELMRATYGVKPNLMVINESKKNDLLLTAEITDALKYTNPIELGGMEAQLRILAQYFGVDKVLVAGSQSDGAKKGQSLSLSDIWTETVCGLYRVASGRDLKEPSVGRSFLWEGDSPENIVTEQYRAESNRSDVFRARQNVGEEFIFTGAGYLLTAV
jgi:hypothetical protein